MIQKRIPLRYQVRKVWYEVVAVTIFASIAYVASLYLNFPDIPWSVSTFLGTAISLILAFKLSQSYDRWWEARIIWGAIVNDSRSLVIQALRFSNERNRDTVIRIAHRQAAWCYSLGQSLRHLDPFDNTGELLSESDRRYVEAQSNVPLAILDLHAADIAQLHKEGTLNDFQQVQMDDTIVRLTADMGKAERIKNTVFPTTYRVYLRLSIFLFLGLLSLSWAEVGGVWQIVLLTLLSMPFLFLERTASYLQDPFENRPTDTAMTSIARNIEINIRQLLGEAEVPEPIEAESFYLM